MPTKEEIEKQEMLVQSLGEECEQIRNEWHDMEEQYEEELDKLVKLRKEATG